MKRRKENLRGRSGADSKQSGGKFAKLGLRWGMFADLAQKKIEEGAFGSSFRDDEISCRVDFAPSRMGSTLMSATSTEIFAPARHVLILMSALAVNNSFLRSTAQMRSANCPSFEARSREVAEKFQSD